MTFGEIHPSASSIGVAVTPASLERVLQFRLSLMDERRCASALGLRIGRDLRCQVKGHACCLLHLHCKARSSHISVCTIKHGR
jgi:hypothetical protein